MKTGAVIVDFGGPQQQSELVPFLTALLEDVLPGPPFVKRVVAPRLARLRAGKVGKDYERIGWSQVVPTHRTQVDALRDRMGVEAPPMASGMMFTAPTMDDALGALLDQGVQRLVALPMFPHFSFATTGAAFNFLYDAMKRSGKQDMPVRWVPGYPDHPLYVQALVETIRKGIAATPGPQEEPLHLLFTPHGLPVSFVDKGDPYPEHIRATVRAAIRALDWRGPYHVGWQSRLGPVQWLVPATPDVLQQIADAGGRRVCLIPVSFSQEHIETLQEIDVEYREHAHQVGIPHFGRAPVLGTEPAFVACLEDVLRDAMASLDRYSCVRCLMPKEDAHRRQKICPGCRYRFPDWARTGVTG